MTAQKAPIFLTVALLVAVGLAYKEHSRQNLKIKTASSAMERRSERAPDSEAQKTPPAADLAREDIPPTIPPLPLQQNTSATPVPFPVVPPKGSKKNDRATQAKAMAKAKGLMQSDLFKKAAERHKALANAFSSEQNARLALDELETCVKISSSSASAHAPRDANSFLAQAAPKAKADCARMAQSLAAKFPNLNSEVDYRILKHTK